MFNDAIQFVFILVIVAMAALIILGMAIIIGLALRWLWRRFKDS